MCGIVGFWSRENINKKKVLIKKMADKIAHRGPDGEGYFYNSSVTLIKRFSDENPRESQNMEKMYLNGVFDGMPKYNKEFKN